MIRRERANRPAVVMDPARPFKRLGPISRLRDFVTRTEDVHVIAHLGVARVDRGQWRLRIDGLVEWSLLFDLDELLQLPSRELTAVFECYGNPLEPHVPARSVANVVWRGVPLAQLLALAGARSGERGLSASRARRRPSGISAVVASMITRASIPLRRLT
jgi:DMSO/TMAO reductase YedYZ molybdopterin-dependent catalytic subunit